MFKNILIKLIFAGVALAACAYSGLRLFSLIRFPNLQAPSRQLSEQSKGSLSKDREDDSLRDSNFERIIKDPFASFPEISQVAVRYSDLAEKSTDTEQKIKYLCKTLESLTAALKKDPLHSRTLVTWASVKQLLGSYRCAEDTSDGFEEALELAQKSDPFDQQALFNSALVYLWAGNKGKAFPAFYRVLELGTDTSSLQREFIYSLVSDTSSLRALVPAKIPQAVEFVRYALAQSAEHPVNLIPRKAFWEFQIEAVKEFSARFVDLDIDRELYHDRLLDLWKISRDSAVTPLLDKLLGDYYRQQGIEETAAFFSSRSRFSELEIMPGLRSADSRPEKSAIAYWGYGGEVLFDEFFSSVGFYLPREKTLRRIELYSNQRNEPQLAGLVRILQSDDNYSWEDVTGVCTIYHISLAGRSIIYIDLPGATKRFWKLHYASPGRNHQFRGALSSMVRAFGIGALGN